jgi:hypothetical protein
MDLSDLKMLAETRVADAEALLQAGRWAAAYYLLGYAIECGLKACATKQFREHTVPDKTIVNDFYTDRLDKLLNISKNNRGLSQYCSAFILLRGDHPQYESRKVRMAEVFHLAIVCNREDARRGHFP